MSSMTLCFGLSVPIIHWLSRPQLLVKKDYYGTYCIDRNFYPGIQADWQYNTFRFEIKENDSIYFFVTDKEKKMRTYKGTITTVKPYQSERLVLHMQQPTHPILEGNPMVFRGAWSFYLVFETKPYHNVFFRKKEWKPLE